MPVYSGGSLPVPGGSLSRDWTGAILKSPAMIRLSVGYAARIGGIARIEVRHCGWQRYHACAFTQNIPLRSCGVLADFIHIFWQCPNIPNFWEAAVSVIHSVTTIHVPRTAEVCFFDLVDTLAHLWASSRGGRTIEALGTA